MITYLGTIRVSMFAAILATIVSNCCGADGERRCGARSLQIVLEGYGIDAPLSQIEGGLPRRGEDATFAELAEFASREFGLCSSAVCWTNAPFPNAPPAVIPVAGSEGRLHFVAVVRWDDGKAIVQNDTHLRPMNDSDLRTHGWDGSALHFARSQAVLDNMVTSASYSRRLAGGAAAFFIFASIALALPRSFLRMVMLPFSRSAREAR
ncbi:MAG: cysteine peptidase family C39 domain-containing protein [Planctomycetota bacterium]